MKREKLRVVVTGYIGLMPAGGVTWDYIQYPLGFRELGCDVLYLEDTQQWPVYQHHSDTISCVQNVAYLASAMRRFDMQDRWAYRDEVTGEFFGMRPEAVREFCASADLLVNISCSMPLRDEYAAIPVRVLIDSDPMFTQVQQATGTDLFGKPSVIPGMVAGHTHLFTFGENVGRAGCAMPCDDHRWIPTRQPIVLKYWPESALPVSAPYTTVLNWSAAKHLEFQGQTWGQKNIEFMRFQNIPRDAPDVKFSVAVGQSTGDPFPAEQLRQIGWNIIDANSVAQDVCSYQQFIQSSWAEFSIAKHTYVQARTGWFSCRSVCYLASARPVVTQDTGWSAFVPTGCGLFAFSDTASAVDAIRRIESDPQRHARGARSVAEDAFESNKVLTNLLNQVGA